MIKIKGFSLDKKLIGAFMLISILLIAISIISISSLNSLDSRTKDLMANEITLQKKALEINVNMLEARRYEKDFLLHLDTGYVDKVTEATARLKKNTQEIKELDVPQERKDNSIQVIREIEGYEKAFRDIRE